MKRILLFWPALLALASLTAQNTPDHQPGHPTKKAEDLLEAFEHGHFHGSFRTFLMATDNARITMPGRREVRFISLQRPGMGSVSGWEEFLTTTSPLLIWALKTALRAP